MQSNSKARELEQQWVDFLNKSKPEKQIEFIEIVFREWAKLNQDALDKDYALQKGVPRQDGDIDQFYLWLVDNIYLQVFCKSSDNTIVKEFCVKHFGYEESDSLHS